MAQKMACIGVGNLGRAWAAVFARAGHAVALTRKFGDMRPAAE
jgi:3-hydroxyacyl-CoA dehydrogenase